MRLFLNIICVVTIGLLLGGISANYSIQRSHGLGAINIGQWSAWPFVGGSEIDPYTAAKVAADGTIPLGAAEGLAFEALSDDAGRVLRKQCRYVISGITPPARLWTLAVYETDGRNLHDKKANNSAIFSGSLVRFPDASFLIYADASPKPGNWIPLNGAGPFKLVLRLYDTPITSSSGLVNPTMPKIEQQGCRQ